MRRSGNKWDGMDPLSTGFFGEYQHATDDKGRLSIPVEFRKLLQNQGSEEIMLVPSLMDPCLDAFPLSEWAALVTKLASMQRYSEDTIKLKRWLFGPARKCSIDRIGRILVPLDLRKRAELTREVIIVGVLEKFQIWPALVYEHVVSQAIDPEVIRKSEL